MYLKGAFCVPFTFTCRINLCRMKNTKYVLFYGIFIFDRSNFSSSFLSSSLFTCKKKMLTNARVAFANSPNHVCPDEFYPSLRWFHVAKYTKNARNTVTCNSRQHTHACIWASCICRRFFCMQRQSTVYGTLRILKSKTNIHKSPLYARYSSFGCRRIQKFSYVMKMRNIWKTIRLNADSFSCAQRTSVSPINLIPVFRWTWTPVTRKKDRKICFIRLTRFLHRSMVSKFRHFLIVNAL